MITNPPYIGTSKVGIQVKKYASKYYPNSKADFCTMFMESSLVKANGFIAMINMQSWMFLETYENFRKSLLKRNFLISMLHLGPRAFEEIGGEVVQATTFILCNASLPFLGKFFKLTKFERKEEAFLAIKNSASDSNLFLTSISNLSLLPGYPIAYWAPDYLLKEYSKHTLLKNVARASVGIKTGENSLFIRYWWEVDFDKIEFSATNVSDTWRGKKWFPYNKGGQKRKWYGNDLFVIDWQNNGLHAKKYCESINRHWQDYSDDLKFKPLVTWSRIASGKPAFRFKPSGFLSDMAGFGLYPENGDCVYLAAYCNSIVAEKYLGFLAPTLNIMTGPVLNLPFEEGDLIAHQDISKYANECIRLSKEQWDAFETSWNFKLPRIVEKATECCVNADLESLTATVIEEDRINSQQLDDLENKIDEKFIGMFHLENRLDARDGKGTDREIIDSKTVIKNLLSYLVGVSLGRYSLPTTTAFSNSIDDSNELRNKDFDFSNPILPIFNFSQMKDSITSHVIKLIETIFGAKNYQKNIDFISSCLGGKIGEDSVDVLNSYFANDFFEDHLNLFENHPIYWLLCSGKHKAFQCLFYLHSYSPNTLAVINTKYFIPRTAQYKNERERLENQLNYYELEPKTRSALEKKLENVKACQQELLEYGQVLDHLANQFIDLDLDDGVEANYGKFQHVTVEMDGRTITKDLLVPIK